MLRGADILCISSIDWDFIWQGHQEIMATLASHGNRVLFIENTGVRAAQLRDIPRLRQRLRNWWKSTKGFRQVRDNLVVYAPLLLPFPYSRVARWINRRWLLSALQRWMRASGFCRRPIVWTFLPTPLACDIIRELDPELTIYYCIDDLASSSPQARRIVHSEATLLRQADLVFVTSEKLRERAAMLSPRVHVFPFGVRYEAFERARLSHDGVPDDLHGLRRPVIGYIGGLHQWVDQELVSAAAAAMPNASFVLIGPEQTDVSKLAQQPNVHLLKARPHASLPGYIKGFDVGIIAYRLSEYTSHVYPTKLNEYLAMGIPVVATDLDEIRRFNQEHGDIVSIGRTPDEFIRALRESLAAQSPAAVARRIEVSHCNSWTRRIAQMSDLIDQRLDERRREAPRWDASLRRIYRLARRRAAVIMALTLATYFVLFHTNAVWQLARPLQASQPPRHVDAIVVFAGGVGESGKAGGGYQERVKQAVDLYRAGYAPVMVFSSGYKWVFQEAEVMRELAVAVGVPPSAIILETQARNTFENVRFTSAILHQHGWRSVLLISSPFHMRRALLTWSHVAPDVVVVPTPVPSSQFYAHTYGASLEQIRGIFHEYAAIVAYAWHGWWMR